MMYCFCFSYLVISVHEFSHLVFVNIIIKVAPVLPDKV